MNITSGTLFISFTHLYAFSNFSNSSILEAFSFLVKTSKVPDSISLDSCKYVAILLLIVLKFVSKPGTHFSVT